MDRAVSLRWSRAVIVTVLVSVVVGLALPLLAPGMTAVPANGVAASGRVGDWVADRMLALGEALDTEADASGASEGRSAAAPKFEPVEPTPPWIGDVAFWLLFAAVFASVIVGARNRRNLTRGESEPRLGLGEIIVGVWREIADLLAAIRRVVGQWFRRIRRREEPGGQGVGAGGVVGIVGRPWSTTDPVRRRIAAAYRSAVGVIGSAHGPMRRAETPRELATRVMETSFTAVTALYEEARYSNHVLTDRQAKEAEEAAASMDPGEN